MLIRWTLASLLLGLTAATSASENPASPLGTESVAWLTDDAKALSIARDTGRPLLILLPRSTNAASNRDAAGNSDAASSPSTAADADARERFSSHPLVIEAAKTLFVPLRIVDDPEDPAPFPSQRKLAPADTVALLLSPSGKRIAAPVERTDDIAQAMITALQAEGRAVPAYLELVAEETAARSRGLTRATFAMHCFWEGEMALARIPGVVTTMPGFLDKLEVVEVEYDPTRVNFASLLTSARGFQCASKVFARTDEQAKVASSIVPDAIARTDAVIRPDKEPKYYLAQTAYRSIPMTSLQAARVNSRLGSKANPDDLLSPRQKALLTKIRETPDRNWPNLIGATNLPRAWSKVTTIANTVGSK